MTTIIAMILFGILFSIIYWVLCMIIFGTEHTWPMWLLVGPILSYVINKNRAK
jgi:hypothetical protein